MKSQGTKGEELFERYLHSQELHWEYESLPGQKRPDYVIQHHTGRCIFEVKDFDDPKPRPTDGYDPSPPIQRKMRRAREQFEEYKDHCCSVVLYSGSIYRAIYPSAVLCAAFGPGSRQSYESGGKLDPTPPRFRFPAPGELPPDLQSLANPVLSAASNRSISSIIVLLNYALSELHLEVWRRLYLRQQAGEVLSPGESLRLLSELGETVPNTWRYEGTLRVAVLAGC